MNANSGAGIAGTTDDALYQTQRWHSGTSPELQYSLAVPNGSYTVKLHLAETWSGAYGTGRRVFDVNMEGREIGHP